MVILSSWDFWASCNPLRRWAHFARDRLATDFPTTVITILSDSSKPGAPPLFAPHRSPAGLKTFPANARMEAKTISQIKRRFGGDTFLTRRSHLIVPNENTNSVAERSGSVSG